MSDPFFDSCGLAAAVIGMDGSVKRVNSRFGNFFGSSPDELHGVDWLSWCVPSQRERWQQSLESLRSGSAIDWQEGQIACHNAERRCWWQATPAPEGGDFYFVVVEESMLADSNPPPRALLELQDRVLRVAAEGICVLFPTLKPPHWRFSVWNEQMERFTGYSLDEINRLGWQEVLFPDPATREQALGRLQRACEGDNLHGECWEVAHRDGTMRSLVVSTASVDLPFGGPAIVALINDSTEEHARERALQRRAVELEALNRLSELCSVARTEDELLTQVTQLIGRQLYPECCGFLIVDLERGLLVPHGSYACASPTADRASVPMDAELPGQAIRSRRPVRVPAVTVQKSSPGAPPGRPCELCVPLCVGRRVIGVIDVQSAKLETFHPSDELFLATVAAAVGHALDRLRSESAVRDSERNLRDFLDNLGVGVWAFDVTARTIFASARVARMLGYAPAEMLGRRPEEFLGQDGPHRAVPFPVPGEPPISQDFEVELRRKDGAAVRAHLITMAWYDAAGGFRGTLAEVRDSADRRDTPPTTDNSESLLRQFAEHLPYVLWVASPNGRALHYINAGCERLFGLRRQELYESPRGWRRLVHRDDRRLTLAGLRQLIAKGEATGEFRLVWPPGKTRWVRYYAAILRDASGEPTLGVGIADDVTEQRRGEEELAARQAELLHATRLSAVGQMVAACSHELAQPLSAAGNFASACLCLLTEESADAREQMKRSLEQIVIQQRRAAAILQRLRDFSRQSPARRSSCNLSEVAVEALELVANELRRHEVKVLTDLSPDLPLVQADRVQLEQVIVNLLLNARDALQHVAPDQRQVGLRTYASGRHVFMEVTDEGPGLAAEMVEKLFEPFVTSKQEGMGLGLSICRTIVREHGGEIAALPNPPAGATFRIRLPCVASEP